MHAKYEFSRSKAIYTRNRRNGDGGNLFGPASVVVVTLLLACLLLLAAAAAAAAAAASVPHTAVPVLPILFSLIVQNFCYYFH